MSGKVTDTIQNPLPYANILAIPKADDQNVKFAITENDGSYNLILITRMCI
ncbi:carboxypeptidase regulatory-like domain-containing protein [Winogradskyella pacifica]|nr:carboxypeptidase regulatory-like domain-containing protein [Winogradskyella pacifica]